MNEQPTSDGEKNVYDASLLFTRADRKANLLAYFDSKKEVIFVNGMLNSSIDHQKSALDLSRKLMCRVVGIFNASKGKIRDLAQCVTDKMQLQAHPISAEILANKFAELSVTKAFINDALSVNNATEKLYKYLMEQKGKPQIIYAHSQGNLITSNVLTAIYILHRSMLSRITVNSYASPAVFWPKGFKHNNYAYTADAVAWGAGTGNSLRPSFSTIGGLQGIARHGFENHLEDDATFIVNRFRVGRRLTPIAITTASDILQVTVYFDHEGLANELVKMGVNMPRVYTVFQRLDKAHWTDVDDTALAYVEKIQYKPNLKKILKTHPKLVALLKKSMIKGFTSSAEYKAIKILNELN